MTIQSNSALNDSKIQTLYMLQSCFEFFIMRCFGETIVLEDDFKKNVGFRSILNAVHVACFLKFKNTYLPVYTFCYKTSYHSNAN